MHLAVCCLLLYLFVCQIAALSQNETVDILLKLKGSITNGTGYGLSDWNWKNSTKACSWFGITCDSTGAVVKIDLENFPGEGTITPALGNLSSLTYLHLSGSISGMIPPEIGKLHNLQYFSVGYYVPSLPPVNYNEIEGFQAFLEISAEFGGLSNLKTLSVTGLNGNIPESLGNLTALQQLYLQGTFSGDFPRLQRLRELQILWISSPNCRMYISEVANLTAISEIAIDGIELRGSLPAELGQRQQLSVLYLGKTSLGGELPIWLANCSNLSMLYLEHNDFTGSIPSELGRLRFLSDLDISFTKVSGWIPRSLGNLSTLNSLVLSHNNLSGPLPWQLGQLQHLSTLDLSFNYFTGSLPAQLGDLMNLHMLQLSNNNFAGPIPFELGRLRHLLKLDLSNNGFTGTISLALAQLDLVRLDLSFNELNGTIPDSFCNNELPYSLQALSLRHNNLSGTVPSFRNCTQLGTLDLRVNTFTSVALDCQRMPALTYMSMAENSISGPFPKTLANCTCLKLVDFRKNFLTGTLPDFLGSMHKLRVLDFGYNSLDGFIPTWIQNMTQLHVLDLSNNKLQGKIPPQISKMKAFNFTEDKNDLDYFSDHNTIHYQIVLDTKGGDQTYSYVLKSTTVIDLSNNLLTGNIPADIGDLRGLRFLLLSHNMLNGSIPASISKMLILEEIDFSYNRLTGSIPKELSKLSKLALVNLSFNQLSGPIPGGQFQIMDKSAYQGNKYLCGTPLESCNLQSLPWSSIVNIENTETKREWWVDMSWVALALGLILGLVLGIWLALPC